MACFLVPAAEAIIVTAAAYTIKKREEKFELKMPRTEIDCEVKAPEEKKLKLSRKLFWLADLLWGGILLLAFEHLWHGEIVPWPPFLSAMSSPEDTSAMLREMATVGVAMAGVVTAVWGVIVSVIQAKFNRINAETVKDSRG